MPLEIVRNDITRMQVDAIVNAGRKSLLGGGGVDGAIHEAAGPELLEECKGLGGCQTGKAKLTRGYRLPCRYIIHTVGPVWRGGLFGEREALASCYRSCLELACEKDCSSVAFPLISSGAYGYPKDKALRVATDTISKFLKEKDMTVYIVVFDKSSHIISEKLFKNIKAYIDDNYADSHLIRRSENICASLPRASKTTKDESVCYSESTCLFDLELESRLKYLDESFSQMLLRKIDEKGITDAQCYKRANIDRKLFSKIRKDTAYKPRKTTVLAFAVALEMNLEDTQELLSKAGYTLSHSSKADIIVEYFISKGSYDIYEINQALFAFDERLLGG